MVPVTPNRDNPCCATMEFMAASDDLPAGSRFEHGRPTVLPELDWSDPLAVLPVLRLVSPALPGRLVVCRATTRDHVVLLAHGDAVDGSAPYVGVITQSAHGRSMIASHEAMLWSTLLPTSATNSQQFAARRTDESIAGVRAPRPSSRLWIEDVQVSCRIHREGDVWTARARVPVHVLPPGPGFPGTQVTVIVRGLEVHDVRLAAETDLSGYPQDAVEPTDALMPPAGYAAISDLIRAVVDRSGPPGQAGSEAMTTVGDRWDAAHRAHVRYSGNPPEYSAAALLALVAQLGMLARLAPWWPLASAIATDESIRHSVFGSAVPSLAAQRLWGDVAGDARAVTAWLQAWEQWYLRQSAGI
jgi:hypothetical protein